ncbi:MAG: tetratricopeptide repeat protein [Reyranella sp.]|uniref:heme biosynthesis protein HemY n=1 Tax=Reyranella sp. TaxID=1929291 RepID=UPI001AC30A20|nr:heme biosynthesis HemY N-terminal domain-containing protein [Reyranella sp.]MBN9087703.1 tetratricopeptide repeat protein [Reyranella sp.]
MTFIRTLIWFVLAGVAMLGAVWLAERPGNVTVQWRGWRLDTSVGVLLVAVLILILVGIALWLVYRWIMGAPGALMEGWGESRRRKGYRELTQGLAAVAAGDGTEAQRHARRAEQLLSEPPLTLLLSAQAAQLNGDRDSATRAFKAMLEDDEMAFLGLRGLIAQSLRDGNQQQALTYAQRAFALRPQTPWVVHSLFDMQAQTGQWKAAQETLETGMRQKVVSADRARTLRALLLVERSRSGENDGNDAQALAFAREAFGLAPERIAVASRLAELQIKSGDGKRAMKTLEKTWSLAPHPDLAELYIKASGESDPLKQVGIVRRLTAQRPEDLESNLALAKVALDAGLWGEARRYLDAAGGSNPTVRVCRLMAEVEERAQSDQAKVHDWLSRAAHAPADKAWRCSACHAHHESWRSVCESCGAFGTLHWRAPGTFGQVLPPEARPALGMTTMNTVSGG